MDNHRDRNVNRPVTTWMASPSSLTQPQKAKPFAPLPVIAEATTSRHNTAIDRNQTNRKPYTSNVEIHNIPPIQDQPGQPSIPVTVSSIWQHYLRICMVKHWDKWYLALHNQEMNLVVVRKITVSSFHAIQDLPTIRHENIATFEIIFENLAPSSREYYIAAEYMELTLQHVIDSVFDLEESEIATIIREILDARSFLQINGLDHCDITPSRVLISASTGSVKIGDPFAIKKIDTKNRQDAQYACYLPNEMILFSQFPTVDSAAIRYPELGSAQLQKTLVKSDHLGVHTESSASADSNDIEDEYIALEHGHTIRSQSEPKRTLTETESEVEPPRRSSGLIESRRMDKARATSISRSCIGRADDIRKILWRSFQDFSEMTDLADIRPDLSKYDVAEMGSSHQTRSSENQRNSSSYGLLRRKRNLESDLLLSPMILRRPNH
ncbi:hypothetical protein TWF481_002615 [Arthrobotrys musiformis]|uniref:cyclin-dependent kinase n=1 Tax=Arthrobotrys musiformis TaxID=47236 RepID=A0AAV9VQQ6_9PEZI